MKFHHLTVRAQRLVQSIISYEFKDGKLLHGWPCRCRGAGKKSLRELKLFIKRFEPYKERKFKNDSTKDILKLSNEITRQAREFEYEITELNSEIKRLEDRRESLNYNFQKVVLERNRLIEISNSLNQQIKDLHQEVEHIKVNWKACQINSL